MGSGRGRADAHRFAAPFAIAIQMKSLYLLVSLASQVAIGSTSRTPPGWSLVPIPDEEQLRCASFSGRRWAVTATKGALRFNVLVRQRRLDELPFEVGPAAVGTWLSEKAHRHSLSVSDGWLVGFDGGEFDGGLWWFAPDGKSRVRLSDANVHGFAAVAGRTFAVTGLAHGPYNDGTVVEIVREHGTWRSVPFANLPTAPDTATAEPPGSLLVLTDAGLVRVDAKGRTRLLVKTNYSGLYPSSMVRLDDGTLYIGMRRFVVRLTPAGDGYREDWLLPSDSRRFRMNESECECLP